MQKPSSKKETIDWNASMYYDEPLAKQAEDLEQQKEELEGENEALKKELIKAMIEWNLLKKEQEQLHSKIVELRNTEIKDSTDDAEVYYAKLMKEKEDYRKEVECKNSELKQQHIEELNKYRENSKKITMIAVAEAYIGKLNDKLNEI